MSEKGLINKNIENMTLSEIQQSADKVIIDGNKVKMQKKTQDKTVTIEIRNYADTKTMMMTDTNMPNRKKDLRETVLMMLAEGHRQEDIAFTLGISQTLVSNIKRGI